MVKGIQHQDKEWTKSISFKIIIAVLGPLFFMGTAFLLILIFSINYWHFQTEKASIERFMSGYSATLTNAFNLSDFNYIKESLGKMGEMTEMLNIGLFSPEGETISLYLEKESYFTKVAKDVGPMIPKWPKEDIERTFKYKNQNTGTVLRNITLLRNQKSCLKCHSSEGPILGFIMADFSINRVKRHVLIHIFQVFLAAAVSVLVMIIVLRVVLKKMIQQPLEEITEGLQGISIIAGKLNQIEHNSEDEIGSLVDAINGLAERHEYMQQEFTTFYDGAYDSLKPLDYEMNILSSTKVSEVIEKNIEVMYNNMQLKDVLSFMKGSVHTFFPILNEWKEYEGIITLQDVRNVLVDPSMSYAMVASDFMQKDAPVLTPEDDLKKAMDLFNIEKVAYISVIDKKTKTFLGILARRKVLEILKQGFLKSVGI